MKEIVTRIRCDWCSKEDIIPAKRTIFGRYKEAPYPESWYQVEGQTICTTCKKTCRDAIKTAEDKCRNNKKPAKKTKTAGGD